jgi:nucleoside 2-deoxyribosyltransferase
MSTPLPGQQLIFVGGPIQYALRGGGGFDEALQARLCAILEELEHAGYAVLSAHKVEQFGQVDGKGQSHAITRRDFRWMRECDAYVCVMPAGTDGRPYRSDGTCIELGWASALSKPILIIRSAAVEYSHLVDGLCAVSVVSYLASEDLARSGPTVSEAVRELLSRSRQAAPAECAVDGRGQLRA